MKLDRTRFEIRLARTDEELQAAQRLRYAVFVEEMGAPAEEADHSRRLERDRFDAHFEHLILIDRNRPTADPLDKVCAVYRLLPGDKAASCGGFYSASEYDLSKIREMDRAVVELGRSCVAAEYRGGAALFLMWEALADYVQSRNIEVLFGVASFHGTDPEAVAEGLSYLHHNHLAPEDLRVRAHQRSFARMDRIAAEQLDRRTALDQVPALIKAYLRLGGFVGEGAFIDHDFNTIDVCLLMDTARMRTKYRDFYTEGARRL